MVPTDLGVGTLQATWLYWLLLALSTLTLALLVLLSAAAFYAAAAGVIPRLLRIAGDLPAALDTAARADPAQGGAAIGSVVGALIGGLVQIALILGAIASIDPASTFPFRLADHLTAKAPT